MYFLIFVSLGAMLLGLFVFWREVKSNALFRTYNKIINKKELRMSASDKKGFFFLRKIQYRILNALVLTGLFALALHYIPFTDLKADLVIDFLIFFVLGTYIGTALPFAKQAIDNPLETIKQVGETSKDVVNELANKGKVEKEIEAKQEEPKEDNTNVNEPKESARDRMKRKGLL